MKPRQAKYAVALITALLALLPATALAAEALPGSEAPDLLTAGLKMVAALAVLIGGLLLALYLIRRLAAARSGFLGGHELIRIIATRALAPKKYIALVEVGGSVLTLGVTNEQIACLDKVAADEFRSYVESRADGRAPEGGFARRLRAMAGAGSAEGEDSNQ